MSPIADATADSGTLEAAYRFCERLARTHYENFTVGSWFLPRDKRRHVYAIYAYCRTVDDLGDEALPESGAITQGDHRLALLDAWQAELESCYAGAPTHPVMVALRETIDRFQIPAEPFLKLIEANRMDQRVRRYASYDDLLRYCDHSANPVGHLFLYLFGYQDQERQRLSDATCTALQLTNFWQDVARDYRKGRIYLPGEDLERFGYSEEELARGVASDAFRRLLEFQVDRTEELFRRGAALVDLVEQGARLDVALFTRGGMAVLESIRRRNFDVLSSRPALSRTRKGCLVLSTWLGWKLGLGLGLPRGAGPPSTPGPNGSG